MKTKYKSRTILVVQTVQEQRRSTLKFTYTDLARRIEYICAVVQLYNRTFTEYFH